VSTQHAVYRCTPDESPKWTFYSTPVSVLGGADTLAEAKAAYREALAFALECQLDELPQIAEHTERELLPNVWLRMAQDQHQTDRQGAFDVLRDLLTAQPEIIDLLAAQPAASGNAIIVASRSDDLIASVQEQMTAYDALWIAFRVNIEGAPEVWWTPLAGSKTEGIDIERDETLDELGLGAGATLADLHKLATEGQFLATAVGPRDRVSPRVRV
jgi:hypothetical protein